MSLAAFAAIVFAVAGGICLVCALVCFRVVLKVVDLKNTEEQNDKLMNEAFSQAPWYVYIAETLVPPTFYIAVGALILSIGAAVFSLS